MSDVATALDALRQATREAHARLDHHRGLARLLKTGLTRDDYAASLAALYGAQALLEAHARAQPLPGLPEMPRLQALADDLRTLNTLPMPCVSALPAPSNLSAVLGLHYTLEGSRLGAQVIARQLQKNYPDWPCSFFASSSPRWEIFLTYANRVTPLDAPAACDYAVRAFACVQAQMDALTLS